MIWQLLNKNRLLRKRHAFRHIVWTYIFWVYCALTVHVAGIGTIWIILSYKEIIGGFIFVPFSSVGVLTCLLNMIIPMPLGFLLPFIWKEYRKFGKVFLSGFGFSLLIEFLQIFSRRVSDIGDLLMNTLGACMGYLCWIGYSSLFGADKAKQEITVSADSFITGVWEFEKGKFTVVLGSWDVGLIEKTVVTQVK